MQKRTNRRGIDEHYVSSQHLKLNDLKLEAEAFRLGSKYLWKENIPKEARDHKSIVYIPEYPKPEFQVSHLKHDTTGLGLEGIRKDGGFKAPSKDLKDSKDSKESKNEESFIWWSLAVGPEEMKDAELRLLEKTFPGTEVEAAEQQSFLWRFATSPAFLETSRLGSYRFTFPLEEVLTAYRDQFCSGAEPVMRVYETVLYKQEMMYVVLVHSPEFNWKFSKYPLLKDDPEAVCVYRDGRFIWRAEAMCETHWYELIKSETNQMKAKRLDSHEYYVWDNVAVALHVENTQVLKFDVNKLRQKLKYCKAGKVKSRGSFTDLEDAKHLVQTLWPKWPGPLEVELSLKLRYPVIELKLVLTGNDGGERKSTGNALVGNNVFTGSAFCSENVTVDDLVVKIINTPDLSELIDKKEKTLDYIRLSGPELQAFLLVIRLQNIRAAQIEETAGEFESVFGEDAWRRTMILLTHQDQTEPDIQNLPLEIQEILEEKVGYRYRVFNSSIDHRDPRLVSDLLNEVKEMIVQL
ncbi:uncharacterized protein V3H82_021126 [Fundulus diaphanus]